MSPVGHGKENGDFAEFARSAFDGDRKFVAALARGLDVLHCFGARDGFLGNLEIANRTGLSKPTVTRITYTLCQLGYLTHNTRTGKYQLAPGAITLGYTALANLGIRQVASPHMERVAEQLGAPVALGVLYRGTALYVAIARGTASFSIQLDVGARVPLATTAIGRALLVAMHDDVFEGHLVQLPKKYGDQWRDVLKHIEKAKREYQLYGFVMSEGDWRTDIHAAASPVVAADGSGIFAFNCGAPPQYFPMKKLQKEVGPAVAEMCNLVDRTLGGTAERSGIWDAQDVRAS